MGLLPCGVGSPHGSWVKEPACQGRRHKRSLGLIPGSGGSPGGGHANPLQYSCLEDPHGQRSLAGYSPWGHIESDTTEATWRACSGWRQLGSHQGQSPKHAGPLRAVADLVAALCSLLASVSLVSRPGECPLLHLQAHHSFIL